MGRIKAAMGVLKVSTTGCILLPLSVGREAYYISCPFEDSGRGIQCQRILWLVLAVLLKRRTS